MRVDPPKVGNFSDQNWGIPVIDVMIAHTRAGLKYRCRLSSDGTAWVTPLSHLSIGGNTSCPPLTRSTRQAAVR